MGGLHPPAKRNKATATTAQKAHPFKLRFIIFPPLVDVFIGHTDL
jgi:hypothetical protein